MQRSFSNLPDERAAALDRVAFLTGSRALLESMCHTAARPPFDGLVLDMLNEVSRRLMREPQARAYSDIITFAFWIRRSSLQTLRQRFCPAEGHGLRLGRGIVFHIAPSNVPVNYAYSLVTGLLTGNANIVRVPSKDFPQVGIINRALADTLAMDAYAPLRPLICLVRYERDAQINDLFSSVADTRVIWGGDATIAELRKSPLGPRANEVTFADRFSLAVIDSSRYLAAENKRRLAEDFYNDTYFTDQNACTSPRMVIWLGKKDAPAAQDIFWRELHALVEEKYTLQPIQGINKLTSRCLLAASHDAVSVLPGPDNLVTRVRIDRIPGDLMDYKDNSGYFFEYVCDDIRDIASLCDDVRCQTVSYIGNKEMFSPLLAAGVRGIDRIVPVGQTMDFDLIWDGYDLLGHLTRTISVR